MKAVITPEEASRLDEISQVPIAELMERAGRAVALEAARMGMGYGSHVAVLAGTGNNGGDAYVAARHLRRRGVGVTVHRLGPPKTDPAQAAAELARSEGVAITSLGRSLPADLVVDGLFGGGYRSGAPEAVASWMSAGRTLAIDIPSGVDPSDGRVSGPALVAERTVTFDYLKIGHVLGEGPDHCGEVVVSRIGLGDAEPALFLAEVDDAPLPSRPRTAHKWSAGSVLVVGGARGMTGAALLAGRAALQFGAGAVGLAVPDDTASLAASSAPELLHYPIDSLPDRFDTLVIGPGLGADHDELARKAIESWEGTVVVDADALGLASLSHRGRMIVTPHAGEFERMTAEKASSVAAAALARELGAVVVLKGNPTLVTDGGVPWVVDRGGPELATIGTGDVLAGMIAALATAGLEPLAAARSAAYWHGEAGRRLAATTTVTARRLIGEIGRLR